MELQRVLNAMEGYLELGMPQYALQELEQVQTGKHKHRDVLRLHGRALLQMKDWERASQVASAGAGLYPEEEEFLVQNAFALNQLLRSDEAQRVIQSAPEPLRMSGILPYNLACCEAKWGNMDRAKFYLENAIEINPHFKMNARHDPDLAPIWN